MISRIKAIKSTFNLMLSVSELIIAVVFILKMFSQEGGLISIFAGMGDFIDLIGSSSSVFFDSREASGPINFLILVLGFMIFSSMLIMVVPKLLEKREKEMEIDEFYIE